MRIISQHDIEIFIENSKLQTTNLLAVLEEYKQMELSNDKLRHFVLELPFTYLPLSIDATKEVLQACDTQAPTIGFISYLTRYHDGRLSDAVCDEIREILDKIGIRDLNC